MATHRPSLGVESEFMICVQRRDTTHGIPQMFASSSGGPIMVDSLDTALVGRTVEARLKEAIKNVTKDFTGDRVTNDYDTESDNEAVHLRKYNEWGVDDDASLYMTADLEAQKHVLSYEWFPVEITSPALWATEDSFEEIHRVFKAIQSQFWLCTPRSAGLHVHYGSGKDYIPFHNLRRIAALIIAADPLITQLHPAHRRNSVFCLSNRLYSRVSHGSLAEATSQRIGNEEVEGGELGVPELPGTSIVAPKADPRPEREKDPKFESLFRRGTLKGYVFNEERFRYNTYPELGDLPISADEPVWPLDIPSAVREILRCTNAPTVAELMRYSQDAFDRPAYSFIRYNRVNYGRSPTGNLRTLEFRQMGATVDPDVIVAHGKMIVRLCQWASTVDIDRLWKTALDCAAAEWQPAFYDVFDLMTELDLRDEARVLQGDVARELGIVLPAEERDIDTTSVSSIEPRGCGWLNRLAHMFSRNL